MGEYPTGYSIETYRVRQTKFGDKGNCLACAIATWLGIPLAAVPQFEELEEEGYWKALLIQFLGSFNYELIESETKPPIALGHDQENHLKLHLRTGISPRSNPDDPSVIYHCALYIGDILFWDPHESQAGIPEPTLYSWLMPKSDAFEQFITTIEMSDGSRFVGPSIYARSFEEANINLFQFRSWIATTSDVNDIASTSIQWKSDGRFKGTMI